MKSLLLVASIWIAVVFGCNLSPAPDYKAQGWKEIAPQVYSKDYEKVSINMQGGFYDESGWEQKKGFCIGSTSENPRTILLESAFIEANGEKFPADWQRNTTLDGSQKYKRGSCGHLTLHWNFGRQKSEIFKSGAEITFNLKLDNQPETIKMQIVAAKDYKP